MNHELHEKHLSALLNCRCWYDAYADFFPQRRKAAKECSPVFGAQRLLNFEMAPAAPKKFFFAALRLLRETIRRS